MSPMGNALGPSAPAEALRSVARTQPLRGLPASGSGCSRLQPQPPQPRPWVQSEGSQGWPPAHRQRLPNTESAHRPSCRSWEAAARRVRRACGGRGGPGRGGAAAGPPSARFVACALPLQEATVPASRPQEDSLVLGERRRVCREHQPWKRGAPPTPGAVPAARPGESAQAFPPHPALGLHGEVTPLSLAALGMWQLIGHGRPEPARCGGAPEHPPGASVQAVSHPD